MIISMMKINIKSIQAMLAMLVCVSLVSLTACSDNDEPMEEVTYSWEFEEVNPSTPDFMDDKNKIESTFKAALGATGTATSVTRQGTSETCDKEVLEACQRAFDSLKDEVWQGRYTFTVTNVTTGTEIFSHTFDADDDNSPKSYTASDLKIGDYYYSDGTWSDGGLRILYADGTVECVDPRPLPNSGKTIIGIVFYAGHNPKDESDYSNSGIRQKECHGYVVALTDVHNGDSDRLRWEWKDGTCNRSVGASTDENDWNGYANCQQIHKFVADNSSDGWEMKHFPAAFACETYGNRTTDRDGNDAGGKYEWQKPLAAPDYTSGWFLPSCGQLKHIWQNRDFLSNNINIVKENTGDSALTEHIKWFSSSYYWSSTENSDRPDCAWFVRFSYSPYYYSKNLPDNVRAVLAV